MERRLRWQPSEPGQAESTRRRSRHPLALELLAAGDRIVTAASTRSWSISTSAGSTRRGSISMVRSSPRAGDHHPHGTATGGCLQGGLPQLALRPGPSGSASAAPSWRSAPMFTGAPAAGVRSVDLGNVDELAAGDPQDAVEECLRRQDRRDRGRRPAAMVSGSSSTLLATQSIAQLPPKHACISSCSMAGARVAVFSRMKARSSGNASVSRAPAIATGRHSRRSGLIAGAARSTTSPSGREPRRATAAAAGYRRRRGGNRGSGRRRARACRRGARSHPWAPPTAWRRPDRPRARFGDAGGGLGGSAAHGRLDGEQLQHEAGAPLAGPDAGGLGDGAQDPRQTPGT